MSLVDSDHFAYDALHFSPFPLAGSPSLGGLENVFSQERKPALISPANVQQVGITVINV